MGMRGLWAAAVLAAATNAAQAAPMTFTLYRAGALACAPDCPAWIAAEGEIKPGTAALFASFLAKLDRRRLPVIVNSNGGSVEDAMQMGRLIRARGLAVAVGQTSARAVPDSPAPAGPSFNQGTVFSFPALCLSACSLILAGGVERYASPTAIVGVHEIKLNMSRTYVLRRYLVHYRVVNGHKTETSREIVSESKNTYASTEVDPVSIDARVVAYLKEMGEDPKLLDLMRTATPEQMHVMTMDEEKATRLVTLWINTRVPMLTDRPDNGLAGTPVDALSNASSTLEAGQTWKLDDADLTAHFVLRRGGGGVDATLAFHDPAHATVAYGFAPRPANVRRLPSSDPETAEVFLPNEVFCRYVRLGDVYAVRTPLPPTRAPGLPNASAPLLRASFSTIHGVAALAAEICGP